MWISVIVPLYKGKRYIPQIIKMAENNLKHLQDNIRIEVIFVNDYPEDEIYLKQDKTLAVNVEIMQNCQNIGIQASKLRGLEHAKGDYILFLDQDDSIDEKYLCSQLGAIYNCDGVYCNGTWRGGEPVFEKSYIIKNGMESYLKGGYPLISLGQLLIRKSSIPSEWKSNILKNNGWDDHYLWACLMYNGRHIAYNEELLYVHEEDGNNESFNWKTMMESGIEYKEVFPKSCPMNNEEEKLFYKLINSKVDKYYKLMQFKKKWDNVHWDDFWRWCQNHEVKEIAIYGLGVYGKMFLEKCRINNINVLYGIDKNAQNKHLDIPVYCEVREDIRVDLIVCTTIYFDEQITKNVRNSIALSTLLQD